MLVWPASRKSSRPKGLDFYLPQRPSCMKPSWSFCPVFLTESEYLTPHHISFLIKHLQTTFSLDHILNSVKFTHRRFLASLVLLHSLPSYRFYVLTSSSSVQTAATGTQIWFFCSHVIQVWIQVSNSVNRSHGLGSFPVWTRGPFICGPDQIQVWLFEMRPQSARQIWVHVTLTSLQSAVVTIQR